MSRLHNTLHIFHWDRVRNTQKFGCLRSAKEVQIRWIESGKKLLLLPVPAPNILIEQVASQECSPSIIPFKAQYCAINPNWNRSESRQQFSGLSCIQ